MVLKTLLKGLQFWFFIKKMFLKYSCIIFFKVQTYFQAAVPFRDFISYPHCNSNLTSHLVTFPCPHHSFECNSNTQNPNIKFSSWLLVVFFVVFGEWKTGSLHIIHMWVRIVRRRCCNDVVGAASAVAAAWCCCCCCCCWRSWLLIAPFDLRSVCCFSFSWFALASHWAGKRWEIFWMQSINRCCVCNHRARVM